jgi:hypothetical protein
VEPSLLGIYVTPIALFSEAGCGCSVPKSKFWDIVFLAYESDLWTNEGKKYVWARVFGELSAKTGSGHNLRLSFAGGLHSFALSVP